MIKNTSSQASHIKVLIVDIDGTISGESNQVNFGVKEAIKAVKARGIKVGIATGRMYRSALRFYQEIQADLPLICYQGAWIQDPHTGVKLRHTPVSKRLSLELLDYFEQPHLHQILSVHFYLNDQLYVRDINEDTKKYAYRSTITPIAVGDLRKVLTIEPTKVLALCDDPIIIDELLNRLKKRYNQDQLYMTKSVPTFFEATNPQANKGEAVRFLVEENLGLKSHEVMAIGDNFNDWEMLCYSGIAVAMGNGPDEVKKIADWVAPDVEEDGVARAIERFLLT